MTLTFTPEQLYIGIIVVLIGIQIYQQRLIKKLEKETIFQINQEKIELLSNIEKSKKQAKASIHSQSLKLISNLFPATSTPGFIATSPKQSKSSFSHSQVDLKKSFEALSKTSKQVEIIKSKLLKNI